MYEASQTNDSQPDPNDLFMPDFKFYKRLKEFKLIEHPNVIVLDQIKESNLEHFQLKVRKFPVLFFHM